MAWPYPFWIAHRGAGKQAPENTLAAFRVGRAAGFRGFECDVQLSADGVPFLLHDDTLERTTNGAGLACALEWAALQRLDAGSWLAPAFAGEPPASLAVLAEQAAAGDLALNLELKPSPGQAERVGAGVARWLRAHWQAPCQPLLSSFEPEALRAAHAADAGWPLALLLEHWQDDAPRQALALHACAVVCHHASLDAAAIAALHAQGLKALSYTVNEAAEVQRLRAAGIDGLITDQLDLLAP
ncbi:glycerophosphodiester phosphodiesterase [Inhella sp.]|uniref:glycerophosphodiester phosphodiesterase n=1 Tax=Inhella sp. TaxID=1921806 RepID=UPI0035AFA739